MTTTIASSRRNWRCWSLLPVLLLVGCHAPLAEKLSAIYDNQPETNTAWNCFGGVPVEARNSTSGSQVIYRRGFVSVYRNEWRTPVVVCHRLTPRQASGFWVKRFGLDFTEEEPDRIKEPQPRLKNYHKYGGEAPEYTLGHLAPSADFDADRSLMAESFRLSNIVPELSDFNTGVWVRLEKRLREWVKKNGEVYVLTGVAQRRRGENASDSIPRKTIGDDGVVVPRSFFKIVVWRTKSNDGQRTGPYRATCYLIPHPIDGTQLPERYSDYTIRLEELQHLVGLRFFPEKSGDEVTALDQPDLEFGAFMYCAEK